MRLPPSTRPPPGYRLHRVTRDLLSRSLHDFVRRAWPVVEPARPFVDNWHLGVLCEHLQAVSMRQIRRLVVNVPPGTMKSLLVCVFWPAWSWTHAAHTKWIFASYGDPPAKRDSGRTRRLLESKWYRELWGDLWKPQPTEWGIQKFSNDRAGFRYYTTVGGPVTGEHADIQVVDDPIKPLEVTGSAAVARHTLETCATWWNETMSTRVADPATGARVIVMQRLHANDLAGQMLRTGDYDHLCLPMHGTRLQCPEADVAHPCSLDRRAA